MKTEIGGTFKWSEEQIKAYAAAFRDGDAVKVKDNWHEVVRKEDVGIRSDVVHTIPIVSTVTTEDNSYNLNCVYDKEGNFGGITKGFLKSHVKSPYNIITPKDYDVQEGDKLVWLGEGYSHWVFGRSYTVEADSCGRLVAFDEDGLERLPKSENWAVIPRCENAKEEEEMDGKGERSGNVGKFKVGDRVFIKANGRYEGCIGEVDGIHATDDSVTCDIAFADGNFCWVYANELELVEEEEKLAEQEAFEYLLTIDETAIKNFMTKEINDWAKEFTEQKDYSSAKRAIEILEKTRER